MATERNENNSDYLSRKELLVQRKNLLASINYASFIQKAILPDKQFMQKILNEYFIFYQPRDIISGDFYYATQIENYIIIAAGDCTGHGVPGALMSILGVSFLNEIVKTGGPSKANRILNLLREKVMKALHQTGKALENKDSIDMGLCIYDILSGELQFSGANFPLYHVRERKLKEYSPDKMPVGINAVEEKSFTNNTLQLVSGDMIYLFSDGFVDQFGGPDNKKFKYQRFRDLLIKLSPLPLDKQEEELRKTYLKWKGEFKQVDDIMIFGIRFQ